MALVFMDSFDHYGSISDLPRKWTTLDVGTRVTNTIELTGGRKGRGCFKTTNDSTNSGTLATITKAHPVPTDSGICGFAMRFTGIGYISGALYPFYRPFLHWPNGTQMNLYLCLESDGTFKLFRMDQQLGGGNTFLGQGGEVQEATWHYVEAEWKINNSTGYFKLWIDGTRYLNLTGIDTYGAIDSAVWTSVQIGGAQFSDGVTTTGDVSLEVDDFYMLDLTTSNNISLWGDVSIGVIHPDGIGNSSGWTPSAGANWAAVDDATPDGDSTYIEATDVGLKDTYTYEDISATAIVKGTQLVVDVKKTDDGSMGFYGLVRHDGSDYPSDRVGVAATDYQYYTVPYDVNPGTAAAWDPADVNAAEFGIEKVL